jgi:hypothetical protein
MHAATPFGTLLASLFQETARPTGWTAAFDLAGNAAVPRERQAWRCSCSALAVVGATPTVRPRVVFDAPGAAGDGRLAAVSPAGLADVAIDPSTGPDRDARRGARRRGEPRTVPN